MRLAIGNFLGLVALLLLCQMSTGLVRTPLPNNNKKCRALTQLRGTAEDLIAQKLGRVEGTPDSCLKTLNGCKEDALIQLWDSEDSLRYRPTSLEALERVGLGAKALGVTSGDSIDDLANGLAFVAVASGALAIAAGEIVGGNFGATLTWLFAVVPIVFVAIGSVNPELIANGIESVKISLDSNYVDRRLTHEAGHFLLGYRLGLPIAGYNVDGVSPQVEFYDTKGGLRAGSGGRRDTAGPARRVVGYSDVDAISVVAMAGAVAECRAFGSAQGIQQDLAQLNLVLDQCEPRLGDNRQQSQTRWAALAAHDVLAQSEHQLAAVVEAFRAKRPISECIAALEVASKDK